MRSAWLLLTVALLSGCAKNIDGNTYTDQQAGEASQTYQAVVLSVRQVKINSGDKLSDNGMGILLGGAAGGLAGNNIGKGKGNVAATVGGAVAGAALGALIQGAASDQDGLEYVVKYWDASTGTVTTKEYARQSCTHGRTQCEAEARTTQANERLITMVQGLTPRIEPGTRAFLIITPNGRSRLVPDYSGAPE
jgi:outer membrane lipoprotein SlyB